MEGGRGRGGRRRDDRRPPAAGGLLPRSPAAVHGRRAAGRRPSATCRPPCRGRRLARGTDSGRWPKTFVFPSKNTKGDSCIQRQRRRTGAALGAPQLGGGRRRRPPAPLARRTPVGEERTVRSDGLCPLTPTGMVWDWHGIPSSSFEAPVVGGEGGAIYLGGINGRGSRFSAVDPAQLSCPPIPPTTY